jgi:demethylmenaquinone methyltransferase/2-methoxy-6-polyprenyl-1,4-benzoquinol methylase
MFDRVAPRYELVNHVLSCGIDRLWRRALVKALPAGPGRVLDICTGTGDVARDICAARPDLACAALDFSRGMVITGARGRERDARYHFGVGDATRIGVATGSVRAVTVAFGIRNVTDPLTALREFHRVLSPGGRALVLEFSLPDRRALRAAYLFYFRRVLPLVGGAISGEREAYAYLPQSVMSFPEGEGFLRIMREAGFQTARAIRLTGGIATLYVGDRD